MKRPHFRRGSVAAVDVSRSAAFYARAFGWEIRRRGDGSTAFDDAVNQVSGTWIPGRPPTSDPGVLVYIMVADAAAAVDAVLAAGGEIVRPVDPDGHEVFATFRDPAGTCWTSTSSPGWPRPSEATPDLRARGSATTLGLPDREAPYSSKISKQ